ncbi:hypothetical protein CDAR_377781 [Caerostris darwini]|uniref:Uncharacterized protein n=1 Tax=Caerostris darwini TaxID=1538125 RepID=A0AAV4TW37_9ARAC|nr:hypothetical protein CDAR_377781 [Caerostris darwini]
MLYYNFLLSTSSHPKSTKPSKLSLLVLESDNTTEHGLTHRRRTRSFCCLSLKYQRNAYKHREKINRPLLLREKHASSAKASPILRSFSSFIPSVMSRRERSPS